MRAILLLLIRFYRRFLCRWLPPACRFHPSCSAYALEAITRYGAGHGARLTFVRLCKCHPLHPGGFDPVP